MDRRVFLTVFIAAGTVLGVALLVLGLVMWANRFPWTITLPGLVLLGLAGAGAVAARRLPAERMK